MRNTFLFRLLLDGLGAGLLLVALAYYWLDNTAHELAGTAVFALLVAHNLFNRRWWRSAVRTPREPQRVLDLALTLCLLLAMLTLLATSLMISRSVFGFLQFGGGFTARQVHTFAAYWAVVLVAVHLGLRWQTVMNAMRSALQLRTASVARTVALRLVAAAVAACGAYSAWLLGIAPKLALQMSLDGWDFDAAAPAFFIHWLVAVGFFAVLTHYALQLRRKVKPRFFTKDPSP